MPPTGDTGTEEVVETQVEGTQEETGLDIDKLSDQIGKDIFGDKSGDTEPAGDVDGDETKSESTTDEKPPAIAKQGEVKSESQVEVKPPPKSWAKDTHGMWEKLPPEAKEQIYKREQQILEGIEMYKGDAEFGRGIKEVVDPYKPYITSRGVDIPTALKFLLNADYKLMHAAIPERTQYLLDIAKDYQVDLGQLVQLIEAQGTEQEQVHPEVLKLQKQVNELTGAMTQRQRVEYEAARTSVKNEVDTFASAVLEDGKTPAHPYFDEVADQIAVMINAGATSLQDAYDKAVWANPVTRQKEIARQQTDADAKKKERLRLDALKAKKARGPNINGAGTTGAPTEQVGSMEDTIRKTFRDIKNRP